MNCPYGKHPIKMNDFIKHNRKSIRIKEYDYSKPNYYFVTICTNEKNHIFGKIRQGRMNLNEFGKIVDEYLHAIEAKYKNVKLDYYCIMPNHVHFIVVIDEIDKTNNVGAIHELPLHIQRRKMLLPKIVGFLKMNSSKRINILRNIPGFPSGNVIITNTLYEMTKNYLIFVNTLKTIL